MNENKKTSGLSKAPGLQTSKAAPAETSSGGEIADFVAKVRATAPANASSSGRLIFALDATMSRQPTWDMACTLQADMFREAGSIGGLVVRLVYFRGLGECRATD